MSSPASYGLKTRVRLDLQQKIEILNFIANGKKQIEASKHFNVPRGTVCVLVKDQDKLRQEFAKNGNLKSKVLRKSPFQSLEEPLVRWIKFARENKVPITGNIIQEKAKDFAKELGYQDFSASAPVPIYELE